MQIHGLELVNFCQHRQRTLEFSPGLNLLVGPNGSGKSNILRALQFALTGDAGGDRNKLDDIYQGIAEDAQAYVNCTLSHAGTNMVISRSLRPNINKLQIVGGDSKTNVTEINNELWARLGTTKKQIVDYVFVGQRKVDEMFDQKPADRAASLAALFGLQHAAAVYKQTGEFISSIEVPTTLLDEDALTRKLTELDTTELEADLAILRAESVSQQPGVVAANAGLQQWAIYHASQAARTVAQNAKAAFARKAVPDVTPPTVPKLTKAKKTLLDDLAARKHALQMSLAQLNNKSATCRTCGQTLPNAQDLETQRVKLTQELEAVCAEGAPLEHREQLWLDHERRMEQMRLWEAECTRVDAAVEALSACDPPAASQRELEAVVAQQASLTADIALIATTLRNMQADRQRVEQQLSEYRQIRERTTRTRDAITKLTAIRQIFHHNEAPRMVSYTYVEGMLAEINETLEIFDAPYRVVMDDNLGFIANFLDGIRTQSDKRLSVGERIVLAMAFRIAVNSTFASQVGMLVMDEPTAGLDEHNLDCLPRALSRLKELSESRGLQILFVTHEPRITTIFDNVIELPAAQL